MTTEQDLTSRGRASSLVKALGDRAPEGLVIELGSNLPTPQAVVHDPRASVPERYYFGVDMIPGPGVDIVGDAARTGLADGSAAMVLALWMLEHARKPHRVIREARRLLIPDGILVVAVPFIFQIHAFPGDYWRWTPDGVRELLSPVGPTWAIPVGAETKPPYVFGVAVRKPASPEMVVMVSQAIEEWSK